MRKRTIASLLVFVLLLSFGGASFAAALPNSNQEEFISSDTIAVENADADSMAEEVPAIHEDTQAEDAQPATPLLDKSGASAVQVDAEEEPADPTEGYFLGDIDIVNAIIKENGLTGYEPNQPQTWDFATWAEMVPKRLTGLNLANKALVGTLSVGSLPYLSELNCQDNQLTGLDLTGAPQLVSLHITGNAFEWVTTPSGSTIKLAPQVSKRTSLSYDIATHIFEVAYTGTSDPVWKLDDNAIYVEGYGKTDNPVRVSIWGTAVLDVQSMPATNLRLNYSEMVVQQGGSNKNLVATVTPSDASDKTVTWQSSNTSIATVDEKTGEIRGIRAGTATITATTTDGNHTASCKVTVGTAVDKVSMSRTKANIITGKTMRLRATISPEDPTMGGVIWRSTDRSVATVSRNGLVTGISPGRVIITAISRDGSGERGRCEVFIRQAAEKISLLTTTRSVTEGKLCRVHVDEVLPANTHNKELVWSSSNAEVARVIGPGRVKGEKPGTVYITATAADGSGTTARCRVVVRRAVKSIRLNVSARTVPIGDTFTVRVREVLPDNAYNKNVVWESSNPRVARLVSPGRVLAVREGKTTLSAVAADGSGVKARCTIYVGDKVSSITLSQTQHTLNKPGDTLTLTATVLPSTAAYMGVRWKSSNTHVATVNSKGVVTASAPGTAIISAHAKDGPGVSASCTVEVKISPGEYRIYGHTQRVYNTVGRDLYSSYKWVRDTFSYRRRYGHITPPAGYTREMWYAVEGFEQQRGNCYTYAAAFSQLAKGLGYNATYVEGAILGVRNNWQPHGFVVITMDDGSKYICDPEIESVSSSGRNLYMQPASRPVATYRYW